ncbi:MAG: sigma-E processing peptidase SpoIIGA [Hespellia sp.]|nr:sigma-E processing peptidase SpoIIGA [Hespellia sp.]
MYYEVYIDILFLINFMMDSLILLLSWKLLKCPTTHGRIILGGLAGSLITCLIIALPIPYRGIKILLFHTVVNTIMIRIGLKIRFGYSFLRALPALYLSSFLMGGIATWLRQYLRAGSLFFAVTVLTYFIGVKLLGLLRGLKRMQKELCEVQLCTDKGHYTIQALIDTGNRLEDLYTKKPVSILQQRTAGKIIGDISEGNLHYIPYHSITGSGVLPIVTIPRMCIHCQDSRQEYWVESPSIGICENDVSKTEEYQMILNPDILGGI